MLQFPFMTGLGKTSTVVVVPGVEPSALKTTSKDALVFLSPSKYKRYLWFCSSCLMVIFPLLLKVPHTTGAGKDCPCGQVCTSYNANLIPCAVQEFNSAGAVV